MPQFLILAKDGTDSEALSRRIDTRPFHLETIRQLKTNGNFILGGATLNENGEMNGSMMVVEFDTGKALHEWLDNDPYVKNGVWKEYTIQPFKTAIV